MAVVAGITHQDVALALQLLDDAPLGAPALLLVAMAHGLELDQLGPGVRPVVTMADNGAQDLRIVSLCVDQENLAASEVAILRSNSSNLLASTLSTAPASIEFPVDYLFNSLPVIRAAKPRASLEPGCFWR